MPDRVRSEVIRDEPPRLQRSSLIVRRAGLGVSLLLGVTFIGLRSFSSLTTHDDIVPPAIAAVIDARDREAALALRKELLPVRGTPYLSESTEWQRPFSDDSHQRRIEAEFLDPDSGLTIRAKTHLCLPGVDPCISGGSVTVFDDREEWEITFQLLGAERPSDFQSRIPKSRLLLDRLQSLPRSTQMPEREDYRDALSAALDASADPAQQRRAVRHLLDLLLASFFCSDDYASTAAFAESEALIQ